MTADWTFQVMLMFLAFSTISQSEGVNDVTGKDARCPTNCSCHNSLPSKLKIDCKYQLFKDPNVFREEIDNLLSVEAAKNLSFLAITNSPLCDVPRSVCNLTLLTDLHLNYNRITRLPDDCFSRLQKLKTLFAAGNNITELQDGLFDGLRRLHYIELSRNRIAAIGLRVFSRDQGLESIHIVNLTRNSLQTLDTWPFSLASYLWKNGPQAVQVFLDDNLISTFTNYIGWRFNYTTSPFNIVLSMRFNRVRHVADMITGWQITAEDFLMMNKWRGCQPDERPMLDIKLGGNPLDCNCQDFSLIKKLRTTHSYKQFYACTFCNSPPKLANKTIEQIAFDQFVCDVSDRCPIDCRCVYQPSNLTMHVDCSNSNLSAVPQILPTLPHKSVKYRLDLSLNPLLRQFKAPLYFANVSIVDASRCAIENIDTNSWKALLSTPTVSLARNQLSSIPEDMRTFHMTSQQLSLGYNPWNCSCDSEWMKNWIIQNGHNIVDTLSMLCNSPELMYMRGISHVRGEDFCFDPHVEIMREVEIILLVISMSVPGTAVLVVFVGLVVHRLRYRMFARWRFHPFDRDECIGEDMEYDVFLCCSSDDRDYASRLVNQLEDIGYKVCFDERDFEAGNTIENNVSRAVERSKRTVCVVTNNFINR